MVRKVCLVSVMVAGLMMGLSCQEKKQACSQGKPSGATCQAAQKESSAMPSSAVKGDVKIMTLDPGHFHAGLVQKIMYDGVSPVVHVYAPEGDELKSHMALVEGFNTRAENPTKWEEKVYAGPDYLAKMIAEKPGNVVVLAGNNAKKTEYIKACVDAGLNVFADKPMCIDSNDFNLLLASFESAKKHGVLIYDIMTERSEVTAQIHKDLINTASVFGEMVSGTVEEPAVEIKSTHHFFKNVAGKPLKRPGWFFDTTQQGEGLVDVTTHLIDISMWECCPNQAIDYQKDVKLMAAKRWPTMITAEQFKNATQLGGFPDYLKGGLNAEGVLACYSNGEMVYALRGKFVKVGVEWNYQAPEGAGDTFFCQARGSKATVVIRQGAEQKFEPEVYVEPVKGEDTAAIEKALTTAVSEMQKTYPGLGMTKAGKGWQIVTPKALRIGHEQHFAQVTKRYLQYLRDGKLPEWEIPNMITKYYLTAHALEMAMKK